MTDLRETLASTFAEATDDETARTAADNAAAFAEEYDDDLTAERVTDLLADAPYDAFEHRFDWVVGELAVENEDCTDSREFRLGGFDALAADADIGA